MMAKKLIAYISATLLVLPGIGSALDPQTYLVPGRVALSVTQLANAAFSIIWPVVVFIVIVLFILAGFIFLTAQGDPRKLAQARLAILWGIAGIAVIIIAYSIIIIVRNQLTGSSVPPLPPLPQSSFDYTMSNNAPGGILTIPKGSSGNVTVTRTLVTGPPVSVSLNVQGIPSNVIIPSIDPDLCNPTCSSLITFDVGASAPSGSRLITVSGSPGGPFGPRQTTFTLVIP